jgi:hypothetical protein
VGRFGDKCRRFKLRSIETVDPELQLSYYTQLNKVHLDKEKEDARLAAEEERKIQEELNEKKRVKEVAK